MAKENGDGPTVYIEEVQIVYDAVTIQIFLYPIHQVLVCIYYRNYRCLLFIDYVNKLFMRQ